MATPNYAYEKRQRELAKKRKAEEKRQKKIERPTEAGAGDDGQRSADDNAGDAATPPAPGTPAP